MRLRLISLTTAAYLHTLVNNSRKIMHG